MRSAGLDAEQLLLLLGLVAVPLVLQHLVRAPDRHEQIPGHRAQRVRHTRVRTQPEDRLQPIRCQYCIEAVDQSDVSIETVDQSEASIHLLP